MIFSLDNFEQGGSDMDFSVSFRHASERGGWVLYLRNAIPTCNLHYRSLENFLFLLSERCEPSEQDVLVSLICDTIVWQAGSEMPMVFGVSGFPKDHATAATALFFSDGERQNAMGPLPLRSKKTWKEKYRKIAALGQGERFPADDLAVHTVQGLKTTFRTHRQTDPASMFTGNRIFNTKVLRTGVWTLDRFATFTMVVDKSSRRKTAQHPRDILIFTSSHGRDNYSREKNEEQTLIMGSVVVVIASKNPFWTLESQIFGVPEPRFSGVPQRMRG